MNPGFNPAQDPECFLGKLPRPEYVFAFIHGDLSRNGQGCHVAQEQNRTGENRGFYANLRE
jgi:hypothetical protein